MLTQDRLKEVLDCDPETGIFTWRLQPGSRSDMIGKRAGYNGPASYRSVTVDGVGYLEHRLIWLWVHGNLPSCQLDHLNANTKDNRIANLREAILRPNYRGGIVHEKLFDFDDWELEDRELTQELLKTVLHYDQKTGEFHWLVKPASRTHVGDLAGCMESERGYLVIGIAGESYKAHRLAWLYVYGEWPASDLDHKNRNRTDNRISNLREATRSQNGGNAKGRREGLKGAYWHKNDRKWTSTIHVDGKHFWLGNFATEQEAHAAYVKAAKEKFGAFAHSGIPVKPGASAD